MNTALRNLSEKKYDLFHHFKARKLPHYFPHLMSDEAGFVLLSHHDLIMTYKEHQKSQNVILSILIFIFVSIIF